MALDWEQPAAEDLGFERVRGIACLCGCVRTFYSRGAWQVAWVLIQCKVCKRRWYYSSARQQSLCSQCYQGYSSEVDFQPEILKIVCGKLHLVPESWEVRE